MYFNLAMVGFEPTPTLTAAPSNTETTVIPLFKFVDFLTVVLILHLSDTKGNILKK